MPVRVTMYLKDEIEDVSPSEIERALKIMKLRPVVTKVRRITEKQFKKGVS